MEERTDIPIFQDEPDHQLARGVPPGPEVSAAPAVNVPVPNLTPTPSLDRRVCILDDDHDLDADLADVLEALGYRVLVMNEVAGAYDQLRAFSPEILIIDPSGPLVPGPELIEVMRRNLDEQPRIIFFTDLPHARLRELGLGEYEWHPKSGGFLNLVSRIPMLLRCEQAERQGKRATRSDALS